LSKYTDLFNTAQGIVHCYHWALKY